MSWQFWLQHEMTKALRALFSISNAVYKNLTYHFSQIKIKNYAFVGVHR